MLPVVAVGVILNPTARTTLLEKGVAIANEKTEYDIDLGGIYLSPFHQSPMDIYRAYKGETDWPLRVEIDSLYVGHRGQDTLAYIHALRLQATMLTSQGGMRAEGGIISLPIVVDSLHLDAVTFHSDSLIATVGVDAIVGNLDVRSPELNIAEGRYPLHGLRLSDVYVGIDLRSTTPDTVAKDTTPTRLMFDVPDGVLSHIHFALTPLGLHIRTGRIAPDALIDVGRNLYDARRIAIEGFSMELGNLYLPIDSLYGQAKVELARNLITTPGLYARSDSLGVQADLRSALFDLAQMRAEVAGEVAYRGTEVSIQGYYDIDDEAYDIDADIASLNLRPFLPDCPDMAVAGTLQARGKGINPYSLAMRSEVQFYLWEGLYDNINVSGLTLDARLADKTVTGNLQLPFAMQDSGLAVKAGTEHEFRVKDFLTPKKMEAELHSRLQDIRLRTGGEQLDMAYLHLDFLTDQNTALDIKTDGLDVAVKSPMHVMQLIEQIQPLLRAVGDSSIIHEITTLRDLTMLDTLRRLVPDIAARVTLTKGSPMQQEIDRMGLIIDGATVALESDKAHTDLSVEVTTPAMNPQGDSTVLRLPPAQASLHIAMTEGTTQAQLNAGSHLTDGAMGVHDLRTDVSLLFDVERTGRALNGIGCLTLDELAFGTMDVGSRHVDIEISPSEIHPNALRADVQLDDTPLDLVDSLIRFNDLDIEGAVRAKASVDGLPGHLDLSAEVLPIGVSARYKPYDVQLSLGETPIVMEHNRLDLNGLPIYGADSTYLALRGGMDLDSMRLDVTLEADSFAPVKLVKDGPIPVFGDLATDIHGRITGPTDSIVADVTVALLPVTDITYPIDKKKLAQVKPHGTVTIRYDVARNDLSLDGQVNVDEGFVQYSPKAYPIMPFHVDSGSNVSFHGPIGRTMLNVSASQKVKADVQSEDEETRRVNFTTGVRVNGMVDSIGLNAISFFLEAPEDETITRELESVDEETREGLAATLLATGMYLGESNVAAQQGGYALSSIINSRLNAAMANSKVGKLVDIDLSSAQTEHAGGKSNDLNIAISKSFFKDRLRITIGSSFTDNPDVNMVSGLLNNITAEYKLTKAGNISLRAFAQRDYNNILEGDLYKSGLGVRATKQWDRLEVLHPKSEDLLDTITRTYSLTADADIAWRSNNSLGPNLSLTSSIRNLIGKGETLSIKGTGAYYWALRNRHPGDPKKSDTYKFGVTTSLLFPYLHWTGDNNPAGDTRYMVGYQYENIAGGYGVHKVSGSFTYFIRSTEHITHAFTPFSLSIVRLKAESDELMDKVAEYPQLIKILASDEFVPSIGYNFIYNDYRSKRAVNTMFDLGIKESANLINGIYCLFGYKWNEVEKPLGKITFTQFVKLSTELRNKFNLTDRVSIATRLFAGANLPLGNSGVSPLSEAFYAGGPNSMRACSPYAYGPGNFYSEKYNQNFFHAGDIKLEANFELRFPIVWKIFGAAFVDAGNVWNWKNTADYYKVSGNKEYIERLQLREELYDGIINNPYLARQIALGTGLGLRLDFEGLVVRLDLGVAIHAPYQTYRYTKDWKPDYTRPITTYFNIPSALDAIRVNFGIGYPF